MEQQGEIVLYQPEATFKLEVRLENETVWLTQAQIAELFGTGRQAITKHLKNIFNSHELEEDSVSSILELTAADGKAYKTKIYNLDAILSVGYRVNSKNATSFRRWANSVLKEYLLKGYAINKRLNDIEQRINNDSFKHEQRFNQIEEKIDFFVRTSLPPVEGIFFEGQIFDAYVFATNLIKSARHTITLIDNYVDENTLTMLSKRNERVEATIYTAKLNKQLQLDLQRHNAEYPSIEIREYRQSHDRFLIIDSEVYHIGASLKDLGKKWFAFSRLHFAPQELIERIQNQPEKENDNDKQTD